MQRADMERVKRYLLEILYDRTPTEVAPPDTVNRRLTDLKGMDFERPLYREGDVFTYYDFKETVLPKYQRRKQFVGRHSLAEALPKYPNSFRGLNWSLMSLAEVTAFDYFNPEDDQETYWVQITDLWRHPPPGDQVRVNNIRDRLELYRASNQMLTCYSLTVKEWVRLQIFKLARAPEVQPDSLAGQQFHLLGSPDSKEQLKELRFERAGGGDKVTPKTSYLIAANRELSPHPKMTKVDCVVKHVGADNPVFRQTIYKGRPTETVSLQSLALKRRLVGGNYRMEFEINYSLAGTGRIPEKYPLKEIELLWDTSCQFCLSLHADACRRPDAIPLRKNGDLFQCSGLSLVETTGDRENDCAIQNAELQIGTRDCGDCVSLKGKTSADKLTPPTGVELSLTRDLWKSMPWVEPLEGVLNVFYREGGSTRQKIDPQPLSLKLVPPDPVDEDIVLQSSDGQVANSMEFGWHDGALKSSDLYFALQEGTPLNRYGIKEVLIRVGSNPPWSFGPLTKLDLPKRLDLRMNKKQSLKVLEENPEKAQIEVSYHLTGSKQDRLLTMSIPVSFKAPKCPPNAFSVVADPDVPMPLDKVKLVRDKQNNLRLGGFFLTANQNVANRELLEKIQSVELKMKGFAQSWGPVDTSRVPVKLEEKILAPEQVQSLREGRHDGQVIISYLCKESGGPRTKSASPVSVTVPPPIPPDFVLVDEHGGSIDTVKSSPQLGNFRVENLFLTEKSGIPLQKLGLKIVRVEVRPVEGEQIWKSWTVVDSFPFDIGFEITGDDSLSGAGKKEVPAIVRVLYEQVNKQGKIPVGLPLVVTAEPFEPIVGALQTFGLLFLVLLLAGFLSYVFMRKYSGRAGKQESTVDFQLVVARPDRDESKTRLYHFLNDGERLHLSRHEGRPHADLDCSGVYIQNKKGVLFLVGKDYEKGDAIEEGKEYDVTTAAEERLSLSVRVTTTESEPEMPDTPDERDDDDDW